VGVIGLGRLWEARHKPALLKMPDRLRVASVYDQVARRARMEAVALGCSAAEGLTALIERPDIDVVYLLSPQWFGLHAARLARRAGKPVYCALPLAADPDDLQDLADEVRSSGVPFVPELARRFYPATLRLRELLATTLGPPRLVQGHVRLSGFDRYGTPGPSTQLAPLPIGVDPGGNLLDWCRTVFQAEPTAIQAYGTTLDPEREASAAGDFEGFLLWFPGGALAQVTISRLPRPCWEAATRFLPPPGMQVFAERGAAWLEMPDRIQWVDAQGHHEDRLPLEPTIGEAMNEHFHRRIRGQQSMSPTIDDALAAARLVRALRRSRDEGRTIALGPDEWP
jgi:predicted dehydrogenase